MSDQTSKPCSPIESLGKLEASFRTLISTEAVHKRRALPDLCRSFRLILVARGHDAIDAAEELIATGLETLIAEHGIDGAAEIVQRGLTALKAGGEKH
jgi:hypothetical protein